MLSQAFSTCYYTICHLPNFCSLILGKLETKVVNKPRCLTWHLPHNSFILLLSFLQFHFLQPINHHLTFTYYYTSLHFSNHCFQTQDESMHQTKDNQEAEDRLITWNPQGTTYKLPEVSLCHSGILHSLVNWFCSPGSLGGLGRTGDCKNKNRVVRHKWEGGIESHMHLEGL